MADVLLVTGAIGIAVDFFASRDRREMEPGAEPFGPTRTDPGLRRRRAEGLRGAA
ncbi:hypothetical protein G5V59_20015 [Nocardioides sp. W3-2-3]|nr:hypothetical protein [Nocardioides convexus]